jgi:hypothetical protein
MSDTNSVFSETSETSSKKYKLKNYRCLDEMMDEINGSGLFDVVNKKKMYNLKNTIKKYEDMEDNEELPNAYKPDDYCYKPILTNNLHIMFKIARSFWERLKRQKKTTDRLKEKVKELEADKSRLLYQHDAIKQKAKKLKKKLQKLYPEDRNVKAFNYFQGSDEESASSDESSDDEDYDPYNL